MVFSGLAATFLSRSRTNTLRVPWINTSSIYISQMRVKYLTNSSLAMLRWKKGQEPLRSMATQFHSSRPYLSDESRIFLWVMIKRGLMISCGEVNNVKHLGLSARWCPIAWKSPLVLVDSKALSLVWSYGDPSKVILDINCSGDSPVSYFQSVA